MLFGSRLNKLRHSPSPLGKHPATLPQLPQDSAWCPCTPEPFTPAPEGRTYSPSPAHADGGTPRSVLIAVYTWRPAGTWSHPSFAAGLGVSAEWAPECLHHCPHLNFQAIATRNGPWLRIFHASSCQGFQGGDWGLWDQGQEPAAAQVFTRHGSSVSKLVTLALWGRLLLPHCHGLGPQWGEGVTSFSGTWPEGSVAPSDKGELLEVWAVIPHPSPEPNMVVTGFVLTMWGMSPGP